MSRYWIGAASGAAMLLAAPSVFAETRMIDQPAFDAVGIASGITAEITAGPAQSIEIEAESAGVIDEVRMRVVGGSLEVWIDWSIFDLFASFDRKITVRITAPEIRAIEASSGANVVANGVTGDRVSLEASSGAGLTAVAVNGQRYSIEASSGANITVDGTCDFADVEASSGAHIDAKALTCTETEAETSSGAHVEVFASTTVDAEASSGSGITVHGEPSDRNEDTSSGGDVSFAD